MIVSGSSLPMPSNTPNSSVGVACVVPASAAVAPVATASSSSCPLASCVAGAVHARRTVTPMHALNAHNSWSDTGRVQGPTGKEEFQRWGFPSGRRCASCLRGGGRGQFSAGRRCTGAGCRFTSQEATRHRYQAGQGRCGHTFPPPGGSWYPIRVTWTRIGHQAINGLGRRCVVPHRSGIWVLKGNARTCLFPAILDYLRVEWIKRGTYKTVWVAPGHDCLCSCKYGH